MEITLEMIKIIIADLYLENNMLKMEMKELFNKLKQSNEEIANLKEDKKNVNELEHQSKRNDDE